MAKAAKTTGSKTPPAKQFAEGGEHITPPFKLGHSERQVLLRGEGLPAAGRATNVFMQGTKMKAMGEHVPDILRTAIEKKGYCKISAEIYDDPPEEIKKVIKDAGSKGKVIRAFAFLGEDLPRVKSLKDLPEMYKETGAFKEPIEVFEVGVKDDEGNAYSKADLDDMCRNFHILKAAGIDPSKFTDRSKYHSATLFYEPTQGDDTMNAEAIRKMLIEKGMSPDVVKLLDDNALMQFVDLCKDITTDSDEPELTEEEKKKKEAEEAEAKKNAEDKKDGDKPMTYAEAQKIIKEGIANGMKDAMSKFSEATGKNSKAVKDAADAALDSIEKGRKQIKLSSFSEVVDRLQTAGLPPAMNAGGALAFIAEELLGSKTVKKFGEKEVTGYDAFVSFLNQIPSHMPKKGEKGIVDGGGGSKTDFDEHKKTETANIRATFSKYADVWEKQGMTEEELLKSFEIALKDKRSLTAKEHLGLD